MDSPGSTSCPCICCRSCMLGAFVADVRDRPGADDPVRDAGDAPGALRAAIRGRRGSPGAEARAVGMRERLLLPLFRRSSSSPPGPRRHGRGRRSRASWQMAGSRMNPTVFLGIRTLMMFGLPTLACCTVRRRRASTSSTDWSCVLLALVWGRRLPSMWLKRRIERRQRAIDRALPYSLDLMVACLEGGLSLDGVAGQGRRADRWATGAGDPPHAAGDGAWVDRPRTRSGTWATAPARLVSSG